MSSHVDFATVPENVEGVRLDHPLGAPLRIIDAHAGRIERTRPKLAIVGYATSSRDLAPFEDPEYDIAGLNQLYRFIPRANIWFDIHRNWEEGNVEGTDHRGWLSSCGMPVVMSIPDWTIPTAVQFPLDRAIAIGADYFTSTISYMIAWAIDQGYEEVALFGIDLIVGTEYEAQRQCAEFWLGIAHGRGMTVRIPPQSALLKHSHRYGYELEPSWSPIRKSDLDTRIGYLHNERAKALQKLHALDGALHEVTSLDKWKDDPEARERWLRDTHRETLAGLATVDGALQESEHWREIATLRSRGADVKLPG